MVMLDEGKHRSAEKRLRFACDVNLRLHGFRIHSRPRSGSALWEKDGKLYTTTEAARAAGLKFRETE